MLIKNYLVYMNNFFEKRPYIETSALRKDLANKIDSNFVLEITSSTTNDIQIIL